MVIWQKYYTIKNNNFKHALSFLFFKNFVRIADIISGQLNTFYRCGADKTKGGILDAKYFPDSSAVEQPAVNRWVVGSNPTRGANQDNQLNQVLG